VFYRIVRIATQEPHGSTYVLAHYWPSRAAFRRGEPPARTNDFVLRLPPRTVQRIVTDDQGRFLTVGGAAVDTSDPANLTGLEVWRTEPVTINRRSMILEIVDAYWARAQAGGFPRDHRNRRIKRSDRDPNGVLAEAADLVGEERLVR